MNILFLSLLDINDINDENIYMDLLNEFIDDGNNVYIVSPSERRKKEKTHVIDFDHAKILKVRIGNIQKTNVIEKGITTLLIEKQFKKAINKFYKGIKFDLILYATPPITFCNVIKYVKKRDNAKTYLMLKDIFPQNAVDLGLFSKKSLFYKYFRRKEINLYNISERIGCMSQKNKQYLLKHNDYLEDNKVEILPNALKIRGKNNYDINLRKKYRKQYNIPFDAKVFVYGGNLGKPQGIEFMIDCLKEVSDVNNCYFIICGTGTEYNKIKDFLESSNLKNIILINGLTKEEYGSFLNIGDVGLIFLDYRFTIPNFPSRILSYMEKSMPILSCTDKNTDVGDIIEKNQFGWKCYSNDAKEFSKIIKNICELTPKKLKLYGENGYNYLTANYNTNKIFKRIKQSK